MAAARWRSAPWCVPADRHTRGDGRPTPGPRRPTANQDFTVGYDGVCHGNRVRNSAIGLGRVAHLMHGHAEPIQEKPEALAGGPADQFFDVPHLVQGLGKVMN